MPTTRLLFALLLFFSFAASAEPLGPVTRPAEAEAGTLLLESADGLRAAPTLTTDVTVTVTGMIARTRVVQRFHNPTPDWVEGVYVFPLPERSAVDDLRMRVGDRVLAGEIRTRAEAKATYAKAKQEGRKATLVEQERPNVFTSSVANLGPGEEVEVAIAYQEDLHYEQGRFTLRFPLVVGTRYIPGAASGLGFAGSGWAANTDAVPDAARITPPVADPDGGRTHPATIRVRIDAGFRLARVESPSHAIDVKAQPGDTYDVALAGGAVPADADFVLTWTPVVGQAPAAALFTEEWEGEHYALVMIMPPSEPDARKVRLPREAIFVVDTSGSMHGASIAQAKAALELALAKLEPADFFNVIQFDSRTQALFARSEPASVANVETARGFVHGLAADGGTEMLPALEAALAPGPERSAVRQVVFVTDGAVGNESALFSYIRGHLGASRLFTVGIGSAPNSHFMTRAAAFGRGTFTYIGSPDEVKTGMAALFAKLDSPVLQDLELSWDEAGVEAWPKRIPDVYLGEPVVVAARLPALGGRVMLKGRRGKEDVRLDLRMAGGAEQSGVARLWARRKVASLMESLHEGAEVEAVKAEVSALGLRHHLVTRWTSLVAVDVKPTAPAGIEAETRPVPTLLPRGWSLRHLFGGGDSEAAARQQANPPAPPPPAEGTLARVAATSQPDPFAPPGQLPQGATPAAFLLWLGGALLGGAAALRRMLRVR